MLTHKGTQTIKTSRLCLRRFRLEDAADIFSNYATDERVTRFLSWQPYANMDDLKAFITEQISSYDERSYNWVIEYENHVIGGISAINVDDRNESCEVGYCLGYDFWNKGITTEALKAVLEYLFCEASFNRILAKHDVENPASGKVMMNCGMVYEGRLRQHYLRHDGVYSDSLVYAILRSEHAARLNN